MRAAVYSRPGDPSVLELVDREMPDPGPGEVRVRVMVSGVNPTDWKSRSGAFGRTLEQPTVPNHDGSGTVHALGPDVDDLQIGDRVWVTLAGDGRPASGTAQEYTVVPGARVFPLPRHAGFELGASIGIPGITAHRALTVAENGPTRLQPDALCDKTVLVAGGAGAVGNAAIQLGRWAGATVIATVSGDAKARLASAAGAHLVINYRDPDAAQQIRQIVPDGVDLIVEVGAGANSELDLASLKPRGTVSIYANDGGVPFSPDVGRNMRLNARYEFVLLYTVGWDRIVAAAADINQAVADGALRVGEQAGLPLHKFPLEEAAAAHTVATRARIARELHDSVSQTLYAITLGAARARTLLEQHERRDVQHIIDDVLQLANTGQCELRALLADIRWDPRTSARLTEGLASLAADVRSRDGLNIRLSFSNEPDLPAPTSEALIMIVREALHNVVRHAATTRVEIVLEVVSRHLVLLVTDNGRGFDLATPHPGHFGLQSMRERATAVGGTLDLISTVGLGTQVRVSVTRPVDRNG